MVALFGPSTEDLEHLRTTVESLGTTSVPGLAAALSWREKKTEKALARELARPDTPLAYEPARRQVRWAKALPTLPPAPVPEPVAPGAARPPAPIGLTKVASGFKTLCPTCHVALIAGGSGSLAVCPQCGRLATVHSATASAPAAPAPPAVGSAPSGAGPITLNDRRAQELFAAYLTARPIPCPKCRTPLRHRALSEYTCPSCGQMVRFPTAAEATTRPPAPPA